MGGAHIRARRSGRGRWCRFLHGIVPGRDAPGSEPTTPLGRDARGSRGCTLAASYVQSGGAYARIHRGINPAHARPLSLSRSRYVDLSRVTYGTTRAVSEDTIPEPFIYEHCSALHTSIHAQ